jgi:hypothetical protein
MTLIDLPLDFSMASLTGPGFLAILRLFEIARVLVRQIGSVLIKREMAA